jgi:hypothetical protein
MLNSLTGIAFSQFCVPGNALTNALSDALAIRYLCLDKSYFIFSLERGVDLYRLYTLRIWQTKVMRAPIKIFAGRDCYAA